VAESGRRRHTPPPPRRPGAARITAVLAAALSLSLSLPLTAATAAPAATVTEETFQRQQRTPGTAATELVLPSAPRALPPTSRILNAGTTGFLWVREDEGPLLWTEYATGATTGLPEELTDGSETIGSNRPGWYGDGSDTVAFLREDQYLDVRVVLARGAGAGETRTVIVPEGQEYAGTFGDTVVTRGRWYGETGSFRLWHTSGGEVTAKPVTGIPSDAKDIEVVDGDRDGLLLGYRAAGDDPYTPTWRRWGLVDLATGVHTPLPAPPAPDPSRSDISFRLAEKTLVRLHGERYGDGPHDMSVRAELFDRNNPSAPPRVLDTSSLGLDADFAAAGSALLAVEPVREGEPGSLGRPVWSLTSGTGGKTVRAKVMEPAAAQLTDAPGGSVLVVGADKNPATGELDWGVHRIAQTTDGSLTRKRVTRIEQPAAKIHGLALGSGILTVADAGFSYEQEHHLGTYRSTWLTSPVPGGRPAVVRSTRDALVGWWEGNCRYTWDEAPCLRLLADGTGRHAADRWFQSSRTTLYVNGSAAEGPSLTTGTDPTRPTTLSGRYTVVEDGYDRQYVGQFRDGAAGIVLKKRTPVASALWGSILWSAGTTGGTVTATRLPSGAAAGSFTTRGGCTPYALQAAGRFVYWKCEDSGGKRTAGVYDRTTGRTAAAPAGDVLLGDGYLVKQILQDRHKSDLEVTELHHGLPASGSTTSLPVRTLVAGAPLGHDDRPGFAWTVDRFGGAVAYADDEHRVHIVPAGVPAPALQAIDSEMVPGAKSWSGSWWLSKPAGAWSVVIRHKASGAVVRTLSGASAQGLLKAAWDGKDSAGRTVVNGAYDWTLSARPADGQGVALALSGATAVTAGAAAPRDHVGNDGIGDVLSTSAGGTLTLHRGTASGTLSGQITGRGWPAGTRFTSFGDLNGDGCNDVLARLSSGAVRAHHPGCGQAVTPSTRYTTVGTSGWNQYDLMTSPGDIDGDRRPDLVARQASTGDMYLYRGTADGKLTPRVRVGTRWTMYKKLIGTGDLNGDGRGDLLAQDTSNELWRYDSAGAGGFKARVKVFNDWGISYDAVVGAGDLNGDGRADLVSRDTAGVVWRNDGNGKGSFGARTKVGWGWKAFRPVE
jgi:hypothetical protein